MNMHVLFQAGKILSAYWVVYMSRASWLGQLYRATIHNDWKGRTCVRIGWRSHKSLLQFVCGLQKMHRFRNLHCNVFMNIHVLFQAGKILTASWVAKDSQICKFILLCIHEYSCVVPGW